MLLFPKLQVISNPDDEVLQRLNSIIEALPCQPYFTDHLTKSQVEQRKIVAAFQKELYHELFVEFSGVTWFREFSPCSTSSDAIDIYGENEDFVVAIELDKHRADQVAKKFVSRMAIMPNKKIYYVSLCYPGTTSMSKPECIKYFGYCNNLALRMQNEYLGFMVEEQT
ncbi:hypothetical protein EIB96_14030 [Vibrio parahaemolyticus]|uniref:hypothetical protein n=1 Tax=Vibrio parahaemolyticus TaxID=670 RepID=UPI0004F24530|nr:hypothetical protein [Vibrio parahaemolyticus]RFD44819.1 hypothetical protein H328_000770 [Vibrio parahaemolyticus 3355]EGR0923743.1 hypothetical protein [Vibrio parahaemolyticus]EGR1949060.1 hypothetical protein [Vibrio parahaemolyticus]MCW8002366.1 hypothetical protein [Vibrio parahaemolyticus]OEA26647.1 hypothetical protein BBM57_10610 [Vibrio parahaemolyticus]